MPYPSEQPTMLADLKVANRRAVLLCFRRGNVLNAGEAAARCGLSRPTVVKCIRYFEQIGLLVESGKGPAGQTGGRQPQTYCLSPDLYFVGVSLWPRETRTSLFTIGHRLVETQELRAPLPVLAEDAARVTAEEVRGILEKNGVPRSRVMAVSVSTSGTVDRRSGTLMYSSHSPQWGRRVHLLDELRAYVGNHVPILLENAGKMTARPFLLDKELRSKRVLVLFTTWGLSGCLIDKGHIQSGPNALIGEVGHMTINPLDREVCGCGRTGCLERQVSADRMRRRILELRDRYPDAESVRLAERGELGILRMFSLSEQGDPAAREVGDALADTFASALHNIALVFDPDCVIFQGDYAHADRAFFIRLKQSLSGFNYYPGTTPFAIRRDMRPLEEMDAEGAFIALDHLYFDSDDLYRQDGQGPEEEA